MSTFTAALALLGVVELAGIVFAVALCKAAARRPAYGPPLLSSEPPRPVNEYELSSWDDYRDHCLDSMAPEARATYDDAHRACDWCAGDTDLCDGMECEK